MNHLFRINQFSRYAKTKDVASMRTIVRKRERHPARMFWNSSALGTNNAENRAKYNKLLNKAA